MSYNHNKTSDEVRKILISSVFLLLRQLFWTYTVLFLSCKKYRGFENVYFLWFVIFVLCDSYVLWHIKKEKKIMLFIGIVAVILFVPLGVIFELAKKY